MIVFKERQFSPKENSFIIYSALIVSLFQNPTEDILKNEHWIPLYEHKTAVTFFKISCTTYQKHSVFHSKRCLISFYGALRAVKQNRTRGNISVIKNNPPHCYASSANVWMSEEEHLSASSLSAFMTDALKSVNERDLLWDCFSKTDPSGRRRALEDNLLLLVKAELCFCSVFVSRETQNCLRGRGCNKDKLEIDCRKCFHP